VAAAAAPFIPAAWRFLSQGVPDVLVSGDAAALELRVLYAARGLQLTGAYSRYGWQHPGPAFFYLALPVYELFQRHGAALGVAAWLINLASAITVVRSAQRVFGVGLAAGVAALLAVFEGTGNLPLSDPWNPLVPVLPLGALTLLTLRAALGERWLVPFVAFIGSAMLQTHVGYTPIVLSLWAITAVTTRRARPSFAQVRGTLAALFVVWLPPLVETLRSPPGNLERIFRFFREQHPVEHPWSEVAATVTRGLAVLPLGPLRVFAETPLPDGVVVQTGAVVLLGACAALVVGVRQRDRPLTLLSLIALVEITVAAAAVRAIRGELHDYLLVWLSMVGVVAAAATLVGLVRFVGARAGLGLVVERTMLAMAFVVVGLAAVAQARRDAYPPPDLDAATLATAVERAVVDEHAPPRLLFTGGHDSWPIAVAVALALYKHGVPFAMDQAWIFLVGEPLRSGSAGPGMIVVGDGDFCGVARERPKYRLVGSAGRSCAFLVD
jgi:hypothetical protein